MESSRDYAYYKEHAQDVNLDEITSSERNKNIMQKLRDGSDFESYLYILDEPMEDDEYEFMVQDEDDLGWLGYFIGESKLLGGLLVKCETRGNSLIEGICRNRSIESLDIERDVGNYLSFGRLFRNNSSLNSLMFEYDSINAHDFAVSLGQRSRLKCLNFHYLDLSDKDVSAIAIALIAQPQLEELKFEYNEFERNCCVALKTTFMEWGRKSKLKKLDLTQNAIDEDGGEGLNILLEGLACLRNLAELTLSSNHLSAEGLRGLSSYFQNDTCCVEILDLSNVQMDDNGAEAFASGLMNHESLKCLDLSHNSIGDAGVAALVSGLTAAANANLETLNLAYRNRFSTAGIRSLSALIQSTRSSLKYLRLNDREVSSDEAREEASILAEALRNNASMKALELDRSIPKAGKEAFSKLLCDTSSINNIYLSNHTLTIRDWCDEGWKYFDLNRYGQQLEPDDRALIPMCKILINYPDLAEMEPFYKWKLMFLPMIASWFQRAYAARGYFEESVEEFQRREVSAMYKFIRGVPLLVADGYWSQQLKHVRLKKRKLDEEERQLLQRLGRGKRVAA